MGYTLAHELGDDYRVFGSAFFSGKYVACAGEKENDIEVAQAHMPGGDTLERLLKEFADDSKNPNLLLDFTGPRANETVSWPGEMKMRLGEAGPQGGYDEVFVRQHPSAQFNGLIYLSEVTPSTILPEYFQFWSRASEQAG
jgi:erythromycin esterase-like protein